MPRNLADKINSLLEMFPAVAVIGARQYGKTTLVQMLRPDWLMMDLEKPSDFNRLDFDPEFFFQQNPRHIIFDEAQLSPELFAILRSVIDSNRQETGRFLITGSSSPDLLTHISETLAGRIATVELGTMKANEIYGQPLSSFYQFFTEPLSPNFLNQLDAPQLTFNQIQKAWYQWWLSRTGVARD